MLERSVTAEKMLVLKHGKCSRSAAAGGSIGHAMLGASPDRWSNLGPHAALRRGNLGGRRACIRPSFDHDAITAQAYFAARRIFDHWSNLTTGRIRRQNSRLEVFQRIDTSGNGYVEVRPL